MSDIRTPEKLPEVSLDYWNACRKLYWEEVADRVNNPSRHPNGLLCPECYGKLYDTGRSTGGKPSMLQVKCINCDFKGNRSE